MLVREIVDRYLSHAVAVSLFCAEALTQRRQTFKLLCEWLGHLDVADCREFHLTDWIEAQPGWRSSSTRKARANQINACLNWAVRQGRIERNPWRYVNYAEAEPRPCLPDDTLERLAALSNKPFERALRFLRLTGCRLSDLCRMTWADLDLDRGLVVLQQHKSRKKTGRAKTIVLVPEAISLLWSVAAALTIGVPAQAVQVVEAIKRPDAGPVFLNNRGRPWNRRTLGQQLRRLKHRHNITTPASLHGLRHTWGTEAIRNGAPLKYVSQGLGHSSSAITEKYYVSTADDIDQIRAAAKAAQVRRA